MVFMCTEWDNVYKVYKCTSEKIVSYHYHHSKHLPTVGHFPDLLMDEIAKTDYKISKTNLLTIKIELYFAVYKLHTYD